VPEAGLRIGGSRDLDHGRLRHAEQVMGTVFSFDVPDSAAAALPGVLRWLHWVDATFSTYRENSDVSRYGRGEVALADCASELSHVLAWCAEMRTVTGGYFTTRPGGAFDPSGFVKGWAIEHAAAMLRDAGSRDHCVNGGGDVQCVGEAAPGRPWRIGIAHPLRPGTLATVVTGYDMAVATSGTGERGYHIINPHTGKPAIALASITVVGEHLTTIDACATAAFAMGDGAREWTESMLDCEAFAVTRSGDTWQTSGFAAFAA
jgi:FAD:protein FMN transferase